MLSELMNFLRACFQSSSDRYGAGEIRGRQDGLLWYKDSGQHLNGDFSMSVIQANNLLEDQSQIESGSLSLQESGPRGTFVGVYDGHGGPETSRYICDHLFQHLKRFASEQDLMSADVIRKAFQATEEGFLSIVRSQWPTNPQIAAVGSCCLVGVICDGTLYVANLGDSRAILGRAVKATGADAAPKPSVNGAATTNGTIPPSSSKPNFRQHPYRPPPYRNHHNHHRTRRNLCCCFCFWTIIIVLGLILLAAIAGAALYVLYRPHRPQFTISSLRISKLNLTTSPDSSASHLSSLFNLTLSSFNPNSHITFSYDPFLISTFSNSVLLANGSIPAFISGTKNQTVFRTLMSGAEDLDADSVTSLRSDLKKRGGTPLTIEMDTKVKVKIGRVNSKKVGIRVSCEGIKGIPPRGKTPTVASVSDADCKVDLRIKIWIFTL